MAFGFGGAPPAQMSPDDLARLFSRVPFGALQSFSGSSDILPLGDGAPQAGETSVPLPPPRPAGLASASIAAPAPPTADVATTGSVGIGLPSPATAPAPPAAPKPAPASDDEGSGPSFANFRANGGMDLLGALGVGLGSSPTMAGGIAAGMQLAQKNEATRAATDLAKAEYGLKASKLAQEQRALTGNAQYVKNALRKQGQDITDEQALSFGGNQTFMSELLKGALPPTELFKQFTDPATGNEYNVNSRTGQKSLIAAGRNDKPTFGEVGIGDGTMRTKALIGRDGTVTNVGVPYSPKAGVEFTQNAERAEEKARGEGIGKRMNEIAADGADASAELAANQRAAFLLRSVDPGARTAALEWVRQQTGVALDPNATNVQAASAALEYLVPRMRVPGTGASSDRDMASFRGSLASLKGTPEGNEIALATVGALSLHRKQRADIAAEWQLGEISAKEAQRRMDALPDPFEGFKGWQAKQSGERSAETSQRSGESPTPATDPLSNARAAIAAGANRQKVMQRLLQNGINPKGL